MGEGNDDAEMVPGDGPAVPAYRMPGLGMCRHFPATADGWVAVPELRGRGCPGRAAVPQLYAKNSNVVSDFHPMNDDDLPKVPVFRLDATIREEALRDAVAGLTRGDRGWFRRTLGELLGCRPTVEAMSAFAEKHPDRWAQAVSIMAGLSGFDRGVGATINIYNVDQLSDAQLMARQIELDAQLSASRPGHLTRLAPAVEDAVVVESGPPAEDTQEKREGAE